MENKGFTIAITLATIGVICQIIGLVGRVVCQISELEDNNTVLTTKLDSLTAINDSLKIEAYTLEYTYNKLSKQDSIDVAQYKTNIKKTNNNLR